MQRAQLGTAARVKTFIHPQTAVGDLDAGSAAALIAAASDVTLIVDAQGKIRDMAFQSAELLHDLDDSGTWLGRELGTTVALDSRTKITQILREAGGANEPRWRHVNHLAIDGRSVPVLYCGVQVGVNGRVVMFGRDLRAMSQLQQRLMNAQQSLERDYGKLRDIEMRYRLLFQLSSEAVLIFDPAKKRVTEANPAACEIFGDDVVGQSLAHMFAPEIIAPIEAQMEAGSRRVRAGGVAGAAAAGPAGHGEDVAVPAREHEPAADAHLAIGVACERPAGREEKAAAGRGIRAGWVRRDRR